jgi:sugar phosphate isomerase/epimerase
LTTSADPKVLARYKEQMQQTGLPICSLMMGLFTGTTKHHNVPADIRRLQGRIGQFHFKNGDKYLDAEKAKFEPIAAAIKETGYKGWIVLETSSPSQNAIADAKRNGDYVRSLFA